MKPEVSTALPSRPRSPRLLVTTLATFAITAAAMAGARESRAEQFVVVDATFTYTWDMAVNAKPSKSHFYVNEGNFLKKDRPVNWLAPIDYRNGTVHLRVEVLEKPAGNQPCGWALCYVANSGGYGCPYTNYYTSTGVYDRDVSMKTFYNNATLNWAQGIKQVDFVYTINGTGSGHVSNFPNLKDATTPTKVRITMIQVSAGSTYDPKALGFNAPAAETPPEMSRDGGTAVDVAPDPTGQGGTGGTSSGTAGAGGRGDVTSAGGTTGASSGGTTGAGNTGAGGVSASGGTSGGTVAGTGGASGGSAGPAGNTNVGSGKTVSGGCAMAGTAVGSGWGALGWMALALMMISRAFGRNPRKQ